MTTDRRKLLQLDRFECEGGSGLRIESTWNNRAIVVLDAHEAAELCRRIQVLFPEYFADASAEPPGFVSVEGLRQAGKVDL